MQFVDIAGLVAGASKGEGLVEGEGAGVLLGRAGLQQRVAAGAVLLLLWGLAVFGFALDRYAASFWPMLYRLTRMVLRSG